MIAWLGPVCAALCLSSGDPYLRYRDQVVDSVQVEAPAGFDVPTLRALVDIQPGYLLDPGDVQQAIARLYALGRFAQIDFFVAPHGASLGIRFVLSPIFRAGEVRIDDLREADDAGLRGALKLVAGDEIDGRSQAVLLDRAQQYLSHQGFPDAVVRLSRFDIPAVAQANFRLRVEEGAPRRLGSIDFAGTPRLPPELLRDMLRSHTGAPLSQDTLNEDREALLAGYAEHDFLEARIDAPAIRQDAAGVWHVVFHIEAGLRTALHTVGNHVFNQAELLRLVQRKTALGLVATARLLAQNIRNHYVRHGYAAATVKVAQVLDDGGVRRVIFQIDEGVPQRIDRINFSGNTAFPTELLQAQMAALLRRELREDDAFSALSSGTDRLRTGALAHTTAGKGVGIALAQRYVPEVIATASAQITAAYHDAGFLQAEVSEPVPNVRREALALVDTVTLNIAVQEGPQTFVDSLSFAGNQSIGAADLLALCEATTRERAQSAPLLPGAPISPSGVEDARIAIVRRYRDMGYLYVRVFVRTDMQPDPHFADVHFDIEEGAQVRVARLLVRGNSYTREGIIRSRLTLRSGDLYRLEQAVGDQRSINSLGVFNTVRVKLVDEEATFERKDVVAEVSERPRQRIELAPGMSTARGPRLQATYTHLNVLGTASIFTASLRLNRQLFFDLFGNYAEELRARYASYAGSKQFTHALEREVRLGMRSPPLAIKSLDPILRADIVDQRVNAVRYSLNSDTLVLGVDARLPARFRASVEAQLGLVKLECDEKIDPNCNEQPDLRRLQSRPIDVGQFWILKGGPSISWDARDNPLNPTSGLYTSLKYTYATGEASRGTRLYYLPFAFAKYEGTVTGYMPLLGPVLALSARAGYIDLRQSQVPIDERFFLGGRDTVRGFVESTMVPQDVCLGPGQKTPGCVEQLLASTLGLPLSRGGNSFLLVKSELRIPITENLALAMFADLGNLWVDISKVTHIVVRLGTGIGARYATPVGALAIDLGVNPAPRSLWGESRTQLHFSIGAF